MSPEGSPSNSPKKQTEGRWKKNDSTSEDEEKEPKEEAWYRIPKG